MNKLIEKLKTILPLTRSKIIFSIVLFVTCYLFSFLFINSINNPSVGLTILINFVPTIIIFAFLTALNILIPKILKAQVNKIQNFIIFNIVFAVELLSYTIVMFCINLILPILFPFISTILLVSLCWLNIIFQFKFYAPLIGNENEVLYKIKFINILILTMVLVVWFIL